MIDPEKEALVKEFSVLPLGAEHYGGYALLATKSSVPSSFLLVSESLNASVHSYYTTMERANLFFGSSFPNEDQAKEAILYAEAMSAIKEFNEADPESIDDEEYSYWWSNVKRRVGQLERLRIVCPEDTKDIRRWVEEYYRSPLGQFRFLTLRQFLREN